MNLMQSLLTSFAILMNMARAGGLDEWASTTDGILALIILLDQFPRNMYRGTPDMFTADAKALTLAKEAVARGVSGEVPAAIRQFVYMPYMHSERLDDQEKCVELFTAEGLDNNIKYAIEHRDIIAQFSRFPHRNAILERKSTAEEIAFLEAGGFAG